VEFCKIEEKKLSQENLVKKKAKTKATIGVKSKPEKPQSLTPKKVVLVVIKPKRKVKET